ncbi:hypothetical protein DAPPUDRAFT_105093 [Daphnia pulex]|uniref:Uncharacterized protein n=1 Tax=Daphnia pulex TaxID=6669 RepID=E9GPF2_DAPPU|nr:hypothetical protein DAPPUDRAFT_105093 [Daphnia pulex]|eukprot:EFX78631.1 hypothetical protein DAPPUDRAFT_105093 [Daphnia pulex]
MPALLWLCTPPLVAFYLNPFYIALELSALSTRIQQELDDEDDEQMISDDPSGLISVLEKLRNRYEKLRRAIDPPILSEHCEKLNVLSLIEIIPRWKNLHPEQLSPSVEVAGEELATQKEVNLVHGRDSGSRGCCPGRGKCPTSLPALLRLCTPPL